MADPKKEPFEPSYAVQPREKFPDPALAGARLECKTTVGKKGEIRDMPMSGMGGNGE